jgi:hypothetical protein
MMQMKHRISLGVAACLCMQVAGGAVLAGQNANRLGEAKGLYESAEYDRAFAVLERMNTAALTPELVRDRLLYQALCLLALENITGAESKIEEIVQADPLFAPGRDVPPRLREIVDEVRIRLRPAIVAEHYRSGKALFEAGDHASALRELTLVIQLAGGANAGADSAALAEIRVLAMGFRDLARRALATPAAPVSTPGPAPVPALEAVIVPPVVIRQDMPAWPPSRASRMRRLDHGSLSGVLQIVIGKTGQVNTVTLMERIHPVYDALLVSAAKEWRYEPATLNGQPIEFVKRLNVRIAVK